MVRYCHILVSIVRIINCKRLWRKLSLSIRDANPAFPWIQKQNKKKTQNHSRNGRKADEDSQPEPSAYMSTVLLLLDSRLPSCPTIPQIPRQAYTSFSVPHTQIQISFPSISNTFKICSPCEIRTVNFPSTRKRRNLPLLLEKRTWGSGGGQTPRTLGPSELWNIGQFTGTIEIYILLYVVVLYHSASLTYSLKMLNTKTQSFLWKLRNVCTFLTNQFLKFLN
jgi:hypothetical protein